MKKVILLIFSLLILGIFLFFSNLNLVLNNSSFKNLLFSALKAKYHLNKICYDKVLISLRKGLIKFDNLHIYSPRFKTELKKLHVRIAFKKLLHLQNPLKGFYVNEGNFIYISKASKDSHIKLPDLKNFKNFSFLEPLHVKFTDLHLAIKENGKLVSVGNADGELRFEHGQLLFEGEIIRGEILKRVSLKGRFNYVSSLFEVSLLVKNINLGQIPVLNNILKFTDIDFQARAVLENGRINLVFLGKAPRLLFRNISNKVYSCAYFEGIGFYQNGTFEIKVNPVKLNFPQTQVTLSFKGKNGYYKFSLNTPSIKAEEALPVVELFLPKKVLPYFKGIKKGMVSDLEFSARSSALKTLFHFPHLSLKGKITKGEYILPLFGTLPFSNFDGKLCLKHGILKVKGSAEIKGIARLINISLKLQKEKHIKIALSSRIKGDSRAIKKFLLVHWEIFKPIERYKTYGNADIIFKLSYTHPFLSIVAKNLMPVNLILPQFKGAATLYGASLDYKSNVLSFYAEKVIHKDFSAHNISGRIDFNKDFNKTEFETRIKRSVISKRFIQNFWTPDFSALTDYNFSKLVLENFIYKGPLPLQLNKLCLKGKLYTLSLLLQKKGKKIRVKAPLVEFEVKNKVVNFSSPRIFLGSSPFKITGSYKEGTFVLSGSGIVLRKDLRFLKTDMVVKDFSFKKQGKKFLYKGTHLLNSLKVALNFDGTLNNFNLIANILGAQTNFDLKIQKSSVYKVKARGIIVLRELNFLFPEVNMEGKINSTLSFSFVLPKGELKEILNDYLVKKEQGKGFIRAENVKLRFGKQINMGFSFDMKFFPRRVNLKSLVFNFNNHKIKGNFSIEKKKRFFLVGGELEGNVLDLRGIKVSTRKPSHKYWKYIKNLPVSAELRLRLSQVILPSYHHIENLNLMLKYYEGGSFFISLDKARFCTLDLKGVLDYSPDYKYVFIQILPSSGDFLDLFSCLYPQNMPRVLLEGPFEAKGFFYSDGEKSIWENPYGELIVISKKGYLYRVPLLAKILGFLSPIDIFRGKIPNLENNLLEYDELDFKGVVKKSYFDLKEFFLSAPGFRLFGEGKVNYPWGDKKISLTFYASPFKTLDVILEKIPLVKRMLGKTRMFIYLPLEVVGTYKHIKIIPLHPESLGKGVSEFFLRLFGLSPEAFSKSKKPKILKKIKKTTSH